MVLNNFPFDNKNKMLKKNIINEGEWNHQVLIKTNLVVTSVNKMHILATPTIGIVAT